MKAVAGCAAALNTETGTLGYVGPLVNHETRRIASAAYLGARYCYERYRGLDPHVLRFRVTWIGFWFHIPGQTLDPSTVTNDFFNAGADVVLSGLDTQEAVTVAEQRATQGERVFAIPYLFKGACANAPQACLGVPYINWGPSYLKVAEQVRNGSWEPTWEWVGPDWADINSQDTSAVGFNFGPALTGDRKARLDEFIAELSSGNFVLFKGPLKFQDGATFLVSGQTATDDQAWYLPKLLEGMEGPSE